MDFETFRAKLTVFLGQFESGEEFIAYCEGNGVKGDRGVPQWCLMSIAIKRALGYDGTVSVVTRANGFFTVGVGEPGKPATRWIQVGGPLGKVPAEFDSGKWRHLVTGAPRRRGCPNANVP